MSDLFVVAFEEELKAEKVRLDLLSLKLDHLLDVEEASAAKSSRPGSRTRIKPNFKQPSMR